ncbi:prepilin-type cleavage/methylation domain-containing protein, partial [Salmonella enterica subsp. enterica serovar Enteritidis]|nr:prepilin-type cleavage/methylation domain-containing protein [Salmonella enterica subsp. enterica serovar Enteritidis]
SGNIQGHTLQPTSTNTTGGTCPSIGLISKDNMGNILSCVNGKWSVVSNLPVGSPVPWPSNTAPVGWLICRGQSFNTALYPQL